MLDKATLKTEIKNLLADMESRDVDAKDEFATRLSNAIDSYVKGMTIIYIAGLATAAGGGAVSGTFQHQIS